MGFFSTVQPLTTYKTASPTTPFSTMTESLISESFPLLTANQFLAQAIWTGTPTGTLSIMGSIDNVNFNMPISSFAVTGSAGSYSYDLYGTSATWVRIAYTFTSGTGTLTCKAAIKVPN